jgi:membrane-bound serine protease (ClpP class)
MAALAVGATRDVYRIRVATVIGPGVDRYVQRVVRDAEESRAAAVVIELDTPGGLLQSTDGITKTLLNARVPVIVYITPSGGRAASAGVFITYAAHIAAMAPTTHLGAAHPVDTGGGASNTTMMEKVTNDSVAHIRAIARRRGRNADWAEEAIRKSTSIDEEAAVRLKVVNLIAKDLRALLDQVDGRTVETEAGSVRLQTRGAAIRTVEMDYTERALDLLGNPNIGLILMTIATYGIIFELSSPGSVFPGVVGAIALILAFVSFAIVEVNVAGVALIALSFLFFIADIKVPSHGVLTGGGILSFFLGALFLTSRQDPILQVSIRLIVFLTTLTAAFFLFAVGAGVRAQRAVVRSGREGLLGADGVARTDLDPDGTVYVAKELWTATAEGETIRQGERVVVVGIDSLRLRVRRLH